MIAPELAWDRALNAPPIWTTDTQTPFIDLGMVGWSDDTIGEYFENKDVLDIGSGMEGIARRLFQIFGDAKGSPRVVSLNPQLQSGHMSAQHVYTGKDYNGAGRTVDLGIEDMIRAEMERADEDVERYFATRTAVAGIIEYLEFPDDSFDVQVSTWAFPRVGYDADYGYSSGAKSYREIMRTQRHGGIALLGPIYVHEKEHIRGVLRQIKTPYTSGFDPCTPGCEVLRLKSG